MAFDRNLEADVTSPSSLRWKSMKLDDDSCKLSVIKAMN